MVGPGRVGQASFQHGARSAPSRRRTCRGGRRTARREVRVEREPQQAAIPVVVDLRAQVDDLGRRRAGEAVEDLQQTALLGDEDAPVGREADVRRVCQTREDDRVREACGEAGGRGCNGGLRIPEEGLRRLRRWGGIAADAMVTRRKVTAAAADNFAIRLFTDARMGEDEADSLPARRQTAGTKARRTDRASPGRADQDAAAARQRRSASSGPSPSSNDSRVPRVLQESGGPNFAIPPVRNIVGRRCSTTS